MPGANASRVGEGEFDHRLDEPPVRQYPVLERRVRIGLAENPESVAQAEVVGREARPMIERVPVHAERPRHVSVEEELPLVPIPHALADRWKPLVPQQIRDARVSGRVQGRRVREVIGVERPVRSVKVQGHVRIVLLHQA
jgi:hypothetical protein